MLQWNKIRGLLVAISVGVLFFLLIDVVFSSYLFSALQIGDFRQTQHLEGDNGWYELRKNYQGSDTWGARKYQVWTNSLGFRTSHAGFREKKTKGDVIFLGDSFTYGTNGPWEETFVGMFEAHSGARVLNAGVSSYSPTAYLHQYRKALRADALASPHTVVVGLDMSDVQDEAGYWIDGDKHPRKSDQELQYRQEFRIRPFLVAKLNFTKFIWRLRYIVGASVARSDEAIFAMPRSAFTFDSWEKLDKDPPYADSNGYAPLGVRGGLLRVREKVGEIIRLAGTHNAAVYILVYPWPAQLKYADKFNWVDFVSGVCREFGCAGVVDTFPRFREMAQKHPHWYEELFVIGDVHFSEAGNRVIFQELVQHLPSKEKWYVESRH